MILFQLTRRHRVKYKVARLARREGIPIARALAAADLADAKSKDDILEALKRPWTIDLQARTVTWEQRLSVLPQKTRNKLGA